MNQKPMTTGNNILWGSFINHSSIKKNTAQKKEILREILLLKTSILCTINTKTKVFMVFIPNRTDSLSFWQLIKTMWEELFSIVNVQKLKIHSCSWLITHKFPWNKSIPNSTIFSLITTLKTLERVKIKLTGQEKLLIFIKRKKMEKPQKKFALSKLTRAKEINWNSSDSFGDKFGQKTKDMTTTNSMFQEKTNSTNKE